MLLDYNHRDKLNRIIRGDDIVIWSNGKYNQPITVARVVGVTKQKVRIHVLISGKTTLSYPCNLVVITQQVNANLEGNVGANMDLEETR
ncbi:hypothetical protein pSalSNUABM01_083 [Salmonella phage pSal-SNUABM-01]|nr:hypothetical protein pSalSNUABM01_083 [Salmonella phage pSal-SNUABM-01]